MIKSKNFKVLLTASIAVVLATVAFVKAQVNTDLYLEIIGGNVTIGATGSFNFGAFPVPSSDITTGKQFTGEDYFRVDDMRGTDSGWYTTISVTDLTGTAGTISGANVSMKVDSTGTQLITGTANTNVVVSDTLLSYTPINSTITFIKRDAGSNLGKLGRYAAFPWLQITIPAYQSVGAYHGVLTYTIIEN
ncbi:TPA: hypothetical protein DEP21_00760 [Patescibacteria group bacterium]|nr:hypothetical protein [Candidatus Gracilibacteria bacterium]